jgi:hypothetical protein
MGGNDMTKRHPWSFLSIGVTVATAAVTLGAIQYLHQRGMWRPQSTVGSALSILGGVAVIVSLIAAIVSLVREKPPVYGILALCLSLLSFFLYVQ